MNEDIRTWHLADRRKLFLEMAIDSISPRAELTQDQTEEIVNRAKAFERYVLSGEAEAHYAPLAY